MKRTHYQHKYMILDMPTNMKNSYKGSSSCNFNDKIHSEDPYL